MKLVMVAIFYPALPAETAIQALLRKGLVSLPGNDNIQDL